jgi:hypothetical protein
VILNGREFNPHIGNYLFAFAFVFEHQSAPLSCPDPTAPLSKLVEVTSQDQTICGDRHMLMQREVSSDRYTSQDVLGEQPVNSGNSVFASLEHGFPMTYCGNGHYVCYHMVYRN